MNNIRDVRGGRCSSNMRSMCARKEFSETSWHYVFSFPDMPAYTGIHLVRHTFVLKSIIIFLNYCLVS